jgi:hypothetical protein
MHNFYMVENPSAWLHKRRFRCGTPDDMMSMSVRHTTADINEYDLMIFDEITMVLWSMHDPIILDFLFCLLTTSVVGAVFCIAFKLSRAPTQSAKVLSSSSRAWSLGAMRTSPTKHSSKAAPCPDHALAAS